MQRLLGAGVLHLDEAADTAAVEQIPGKHATEGPVPVIPVAGIAEAGRHDREIAADVEARVKLGGRDADPGGLRRQGTLRCADVRAPADEIAGDADHDVPAGLGHRLAFREFAVQRIRRLAEQDAELVDARRQARLQ